jgi:hypothetical protein
VTTEIQSADSDPVKAARAKLEQLHKARAEREAPTEAQQLAELELAIKNEEAIAEAVQKHGALGVAIAAIPTRLGVIIVSAPKHMTVRKFRSANGDINRAYEDLIAPNLIYPPKADYDVILEKQNAVLAEVGLAVLNLAGMRNLGGE